MHEREFCCGTCARAASGDEPPKRHKDLILSGFDKDQRPIGLEIEVFGQGVYPLDRTPLSVGRGKDNDLVLRNDSKLSRYQFQLSVGHDGAVQIEDLKSGCGTMVAGRLIVRDTLHAFDEIQVGDTFLLVRPAPG